MVIKENKAKENIVRSVRMYKLAWEFDELFILVEQLGFSGSALESTVAFILHSVNEALRSEINARTKM